MVSFHVPGHKNGKVYEKYFSNFMKDIVKLDITEIPEYDNLFFPQGIIKEAQQRAASLYGAKETFFLVNGTTSGIYSMILSVLEPGEKIIIPRDCHKSVINGIILGDLHPVYIRPEVDSTNYMSMGVTPEAVEKAIQENKEAKVVLITYPNYYGLCSDIKGIVEIVKKYDKILLVDEAHGAHLKLSEKLPISSLDAGADIVVQSTHKSLPSLTQSSMLHVNSDRIDIDKLKFMLSLTQSSSPSYLLMASLDVAMTIIQDEGSFLMEKLLDNIEFFKEEIRKLKGVETISKEIVGSYGVKDIDITKITIRMNDIGISGIVLEEILRKKFNIQAEMANIHNLLLVSSIGNEKSDFQRLLKAIESIYFDKGITHKKKELPEFSFMIPKMKLLPREALYKEKTHIPLFQSQGRISCEYIIPYPPGIPLVCPGEVITNEIIEYVRLLKDSGINIIGTSDMDLKNISVVK